MSACRLALTLGLLAATMAAAARAEQMQQMGPYQAHYSLVPTTMLNADIVAHYGVSRGRDRALLTISILADDGTAVRAKVSGVVTNLLGQAHQLDLREIVEGDAVYYLSGIKHDDRDVLRFAIDVQTPDGDAHELAFQQKMYWSDR